MTQIYKIDKTHVAQPVSTRGIEDILSAMTKVDDCISYCYSNGGNVFVVFQFPTEDKTYVYDISTDAWHERTFLDKETGLEHAHRAYHCTFNYNRNYTGDRAYNTLYYFDSTKYFNDDPTGSGYNWIRGELRSPILTLDGKQIVFNSIQPIFSQGVGLNSDLQYGIGRNPQCIISYSDDCGHRWSNQRTVDIGKIGQYAFRSKVNVLGRGRNRVWKFVVTDPVKRNLLQIVIDMTEAGR